MVRNTGRSVRRIHTLDPDTLKEIFQDTRGTPYTRVFNLVWGSYDPVAQVRQTFKDIIELSEDIALRGMLQMQNVCAFPPNVAKRYIDAVNLMWGTSHTIESLPQGTLDGEPMVFILIAGERRHHALRRLWIHGCRACKAALKSKAANGGCFTKHFPGGFVPVNLKMGYTPYEALTDQFAENTHKRPVPHEEAMGFRVLYEVAKQREPTITVVQFARTIGHPTRYVTQAIAYTGLPNRIQEAVSGKRISYSHALALVRYHTERANETELTYWFTRALAEQWSAQKLNKELVADLHHWKAHQLGMFGEALLDQQEAELRRSFANGITKGMDWLDAVLVSAIRARDDGLIGLAESPFATTALARAVVRQFDLLTELVPTILRDLTLAEQNEVHRLSHKLEPHIEELRERTK